MVDIKKFTNINVYELIGVASDATEIEIRKAYRKKALTCHPDKNPDNPKAAELFHELANAVEILLSETARKAYDKILNAKKQAELRNSLLDSKRKKFKTELEQREREAFNTVKQSYSVYKVDRSDEEVLKNEIERLRKEGHKLLEVEQELMRQQLKQERMRVNSNFDSSLYRIKIKWKAKKGDDNNGGYTETVLQQYLKKYGDIEVLVMSPKKSGSALVEFNSKEAAEMAVAYEKGDLNNPLILSWVKEPPSTSKYKGHSTTVTDNDFESLVLRQMRQAEERRRLIEQMETEDAASVQN